MTTNKPGVKRYKLEYGYDSMMRKFNRMQESEGGVYVRFDDYEALQAECEKLRKDAERYRWLSEQCGSSGLLTIAEVGAFELKAWSGDDPDAAIDAAMAACRKGD